MDFGIGETNFQDGRSFGLCSLCLLTSLVALFFVVMNDQSTFLISHSLSSIIGSSLGSKTCLKSFINDPKPSTLQAGNKSPSLIV